jgi:2-keto-3-deoxy-L-rhamnonate aldolase RhmA
MPIPSLSSDTSVLHGIWRTIPSPALTEIFAQSGLDFQIFDFEHGSYDYQTLLSDVLACELHACAPWVRVSGTNKVEVQRSLDLGARALVFPQLANYDDFAKAAAMMDHPPAGTRGFNPFIRAYGYGASAVPSRPWFVPIVETLTAVEQLDSILQLERIDLIYIGAYDLSTQLGLPGKMDAGALTQLIERILAACRSRGKPAALISLTREAVHSATAAGVKALVHGVEGDRIKRAMTAAFGLSTKP